MNRQSKTKLICLVILTFLGWYNVNSQSAPAIDENIPYLTTFGKNSITSWGDDDFLQIFFWVVPSSQQGPVYLRVYDPDTGGALDEGNGDFNTTVSYSVYGGNRCWSDTASQSVHPQGNFKSGYLIASKIFGNDTKYDRQWYSFGPFNPSEGEFSDKLGGHVFKIIAQGVSGNDGNLYKYFLSTSQSDNKAVEGGNLFTYKYHFRLPDDPKQVCQVYPFADDKTISVEVRNFDWDNDGTIRVFSLAKNGLKCSVSGENEWIRKVFPIVEDEKNSSLEIQFIKDPVKQIKKNNVVVTVLNQYGISLPFYVIPIGGIPVYTPKIGMK
jgi:hypothetical protein